MTCADAHPLLSRRLDGDLGPSEARALHAHLAGCRACRAVLREMETERTLLAERWPAVAAPAGFATRVVAALPPRESVRAAPVSPSHRRVPAIAAAMAVAVIAVLLAVPPVRAGLRLALDRVLLRETDTPPAERLITPGAEVSLERARAAVPWRIRLPSRLPEGYRLVAATVGDVHEAADGPTVVLHYRQGDAPDGPALRIVELRPARPIDEPVEPGAATEVRAGDRQALLIDGAWQERDGRPVWVRGSLLRLILEDGGLVIQLEGEPRDGWDAEGLIEVARSMG